MATFTEVHLRVNFNHTIGTLRIYMHSVSRDIEKSSDIQKGITPDCF